MKSQVQDQTLHVFFDEDLTSTNVHSLQKACIALVDGNASVSYICVDISHVGMIDSQGLNFLIGFHKDCSARSVAFRVVGASPMNMRLFEMVNLGEHLSIA